MVFVLEKLVNVNNGDQNGIMEFLVFVPKDLSSSSMFCFICCLVLHSFIHSWWDIM